MKMVRVIPVHNFSGQNIAPIEEPTAACIANTFDGELLLLALPTHCVEVHELKTSDLKLLTAFPTVDLVNQILHCVKGDYVATLETKYSRDGASISNFVRVYVNWAFIEGQGQAMRARIAGRVTPSLNRPLNSLEMIELPLNTQPTRIACCQTTGNLLVTSGTSAILHEFKVETQQPSKLKFIDFEARPWSLGFSFSPTHVEIAEDFISILDSTHFFAFRLTNPMYEDIDQLSSLASTNSSSIDKTSVSTDSSLVDNLEKVTNSTGQSSLNLNLHADTGISTTTGNAQYKSSLRCSEHSPAFSRESTLSATSDSIHNPSHHGGIKNNTDRNSNTNRLFHLSSTSSKLKTKTNGPPYVDWDRLVRDEREETHRLMAQGIIDLNSQPVTISLPSISLERAGPGHTLSPFILNPMDMDVVIKTMSPEDGWSENYAVKNLLRLKISKTHQNTNSNKDSEFFTCSELKPLYLKKECHNGCFKKSILKSDKFKHLHGVTCLVCTAQEGYMYHFSAATCEETNPICLTTYPFTAPVRHVALEDTVLHALTDAGLESYTLRLAHHVARNSNNTGNSRITCPSVSEPICLIGLRPFLGMQKLLCTGNRLVLLARAENSWTLYSLSLPTAENLYFDILNAAKNHKNSSPGTYKHLLGEAHAMLRLTKDIKQYIPEDVHKDGSGSKLDNLYSQSCALLADYYTNSEFASEWNFSIPYYRMSGLKAAEVLSRKSVLNAPGLLRYLTEVLATMRSGPEADALFQNHNVIDILSTESVENLSKLVLSSPVLREYATEKLINVLCTQEQSDSTRLAKTLLQLQAERQDQAEKSLEPISDRFLERTVQEFWQLLFDATAIKKRSRLVPTFSEFSGILMRRKTRIFAEVLTQLIEEGVLSLHQVMQVFLEYLPSRVGRDGHDAAAALQLFIETYFQSFFQNNSSDLSAGRNNEICYDFATVEAFKILVRSYLGNLSQSKVYRTEQNLKDCNQNDEEAYLFANFRPAYLNKMPPFVKDYQKILNTMDIKDLEDVKKSESNNTVRSEVPKLQALLASGYLPIECVREVKQFLENQEIEGMTALKTLCSHDTEATTHLLMEDCPQAVLQYAKDKYTREAEWKKLIELVQNKIYSLEKNQEIQLYFFDQIMKETLTHLAQTLPLEELCRVLPKDDKVSFQRYTDICGQVVHADHVNSLIVATGHQLLSTLNL